MGLFIQGQYAEFHVISGAVNIMRVRQQQGLLNICIEVLSSGKHYLHIFYGTIRNGVQTASGV